MLTSYQTILSKFINYLNSPELLEESRLKPNAFTRNRILTFPIMLTLMISSFKASVQTELNAFFAHLHNQADFSRKVTAQAFSKARQLFSHQAFEKLNEYLLTLVSEHQEIPRWHGFRIVAADASKMQLFLRDIKHRQVIEAIAFALYLPGLELTLKSELYSIHTSERQMLFEHLCSLKVNDLLVLDRGYPAKWLIAYLVQQNYSFCMRVDNTGFEAVKKFLRSGLNEQIITIGKPNKQDCLDYECLPITTKVRLIRVITSTGQLHVLMVSLLNSETYPAADFAALYHCRWRIEEAFKRLKHRLALENTSGLSWLAAQQDFAAKILADNLHGLTVLEATDFADFDVTRYKINRTSAFSHLKRCLPRWLLINLPSTKVLLTCLAELAKDLIQIKPEASKPRTKHPKPHRKHAYKSTC